MVMSFPVIYCNGDSYSDQNHHPSLIGQTYADYVGRHYNGFVMNKSIKGSCNRRIVRTSVHDLLQLRKQNPTQEIIALIGFTFDLRSELWINDIDNTIPEESNLRPHTFAEKPGWRDRLLSGFDINPFNQYNQDKKFFKRMSEGRAYFYSPYAERINLFCDIIMLRSVMQSQGIKFLLFQAPPVEQLQEDYLLEFFRDQLTNDPNIIDLETFSFTRWCYEQGFTPLDFKDQPTIAHYGPDAHQAFAEQILLPRL
jgi:hypothetical protein